MNIDLRTIPWVWINVDSDGEKAAQMESLLDRLGIRDRSRFRLFSDIAGNRRPIRSTGPRPRRAAPSSLCCLRVIIVSCAAVWPASGHGAFLTARLSRATVDARSQGDTLCGLTTDQ